MESGIKMSRSAPCIVLGMQEIHGKRYSGINERLRGNLSLLITLDVELINCSGRPVVCLDGKTRDVLYTSQKLTFLMYANQMAGF